MLVWWLVERSVGPAAKVSSAEVMVYMRVGPVGAAQGTLYTCTHHWWYLCTLQGYTWHSWPLWSATVVHLGKRTKEETHLSTG